jgi:DNA-binding LacI/PurR family transcriptional regulator
MNCRGADIAIIRQEDQGGGYDLGQHLVKCNVKRVVFILSSTDWSAIEQRELGLRRAFEDAICRIECITLQSPSENFEDVQEIVTHYLTHSTPDAIVAGTDAMAIAAMRKCEQLGFKVPNNILLAGFNGFSERQFATPLLTTVASQAYEMGRRTGDVLLERLSTGRFERKNIIFPTQLIISDST